MVLFITCTYCGHEWLKHVYATTTIESLRCSQCNDPNLKIVDTRKVNHIDYYAGSPAFPNKEEKSKEEPKEDNFDYDTYL